MVHASDVVALPVRLGAAIRQSRLFHPHGVLAAGRLERVAPPDHGLPMQSCDIIGRVSKGVGLPGAMADVAGLAWRIPPPQDLRSCVPWDVLLASTIANSRFVLGPTRSWSGTSFSSLMPLRFRDETWWVRARLVTRIDEPGLSLDTISNQIDSGGIDFDIEQAKGSGEFEPLARLKLLHLDPSNDDIAFDPVLHSDEDVQLAPGWLANIRRAAYRRSREGRESN
nr:phosphodiesterase [Mycobacterium sp. OAS707]